MPFPGIKCQFHEAIPGQDPPAHRPAQPTDGLPEPQQTDHMPTPTSPRSPRAAATPAAATSYEAALEELEQLVAQLDAGKLPLDQLLTRYQRGAELLAFCRTRLDEVEEQIKVLEGSALKPWDAA